MFFIALKLVWGLSLGYRQAVRHGVLIPAFVSSNLATPAKFYDPLAQSAEHLTFNQGVPSSNLGWVTIFKACGAILQDALSGEVSERFMELVLKTSDSARGRGFESHPLRHKLDTVWQAIVLRSEIFSAQGA